jgi:hypothetical protein
MNINIEKLQKINLTNLSDLIDDKEAKKYFLGEIGQEHYKFLAYVSTQFNNSVLYDIGTYKGCSALALSFNENNMVKSFDIWNFRRLTKEKKNIEWVIGDFLEEDLGTILDSPFIMLDIDHTGKTERKILDFLLEIKWKGFLCLDDIFLNDDMRGFWEGITQKKADITRIGHYSGTSVVIL